MFINLILIFKYSMSSIDTSTWTKSIFISYYYVAIMLNFDVHNTKTDNITQIYTFADKIVEPSGSN